MSLKEIPQVLRGEVRLSPEEVNEYYRYMIEMYTHALSIGMIRQPFTTSHNGYRYGLFQPNMGTFKLIELRKKLLAVTHIIATPTRIKAYSSTALTTPPSDNHVRNVMNRAKEAYYLMGNALLK